MFITNQIAFDTLCHDLKKEPYIAVDTEFMWETTYYPQLCLIQIATVNNIYLIDALAGLDLSSLKPILENNNIEKIVHDGIHDLRILSTEIGAQFNNVFDTQIAAELLDIDFQISLANLLIYFDIATLDKSSKRSNWAKRPLSEKQISYAKNDVLYLITLTQTLKSRLTQQSKNNSSPMPLVNMGTRPLSPAFASLP